MSSGEVLDDVVPQPPQLKMKRELRVRGISGSMQGFLVKLAKDIYFHVVRGDWYSARLSMEFLYLSLPESVRKQVDREIYHRVGKDAGVSPSSAMLDLLNLLEEDCAEIMKKYGMRSSEKISKCSRRETDTLMLLYGILMSKAYDNNIFFSITSIPVGFGG